MPVARAFWAIRIYFGMAKVKLTNFGFFSDWWAYFVRLTAWDSWCLGVDEVRGVGTIRWLFKCGDVETRYVEAVGHILRRRYGGGRSKRRPYGEKALPLRRVPTGPSERERRNA